MNKKLLKYILLIAVAGLLAYKSIYFKKLDVQKAETGTELNPEAYAQQFWTTKFIHYIDSAVEINSFLMMLKENPGKVFQQYSRTPGIGNTSFFLVKGEGIINSIKEDYITIIVQSGAGEMPVKLTTGMYFGNAVRDITGLISMGDFLNTMDFNSVSSELNKIVSSQVVKPFVAEAVQGKKVQFTGCLQLHKDQINTDSIDILPVRAIIN